MALWVGGGVGEGKVSARGRQAKQINKRWGNGGGDLDMDNIAYQCNRNPLWLQIYRPAQYSHRTTPTQGAGKAGVASFTVAQSSCTYIYIEVVCDSQRLLEKSAI